ncbi:uncharacterized protein EDB91DRAFT_1115716 [Suillus paluster]|uniref:uncharacterized protein n=1 Tax=Suillus paluster TaxID=48578 RepID=UPI001B863C0A|nr:uncharacterized protein EDB91DRAFT_1115716 [Suillus paluster]KAG1747963.1 hypothetical protein EDB91DRAFT_1115716 [Suillus paluster]
MSTSKTALILGATGATGRNLLRELLTSDQWSKVGEYGRRDGRWDVVFVTLGTTRAKAGSAEMFEKIDRELRKSDDPTHQQRLVYPLLRKHHYVLPFLKSLPDFLSFRSKGLTELGLARLGYADTIVFRPGFLKGAEREDKRLAETIFGYVTGAASYFTSNVEIQVSVLAKGIMKAGIWGSSGLPATVGATKAGQEGAWSTLIGNKGAIILGEEK